MSYNNDFVCIIYNLEKKNRFPQTISLFFPHAFEIACFDAFISFMICHCTFNVWKVILSLVLRVSWSIKQYHLHLWLIIFFILICMFQSYMYIDIVRRNVNLIRYWEFLPILKAFFSMNSVEIVFLSIILLYIVWTILLSNNKHQSLCHYCSWKHGNPVGLFLKNFPNIKHQMSHSLCLLFQLCDLGLQDI